ncbi:hypothetical protein [Microbacterium sp. CH12i]|uniref:hypothetical protein n=1 Tax=Microbacterium sp. CH12i TaxID=1479651 RepID=UPI000A739513|nr:hypothetical protein [Microbacterium sp. CH12i]
MSTDTTPARTEATTDLPWVALDCFVTRILGHYATEEEAVAAATEFGNCSFAYRLTT